MPWSGAEFRERHNHRLTPAHATHAASVANAILRRTGDEGLAIRTANAREGRAAGGLIPRYDDGGAIGGVAPSATTMNPNTQGLIQKLSALPPEKLQETIVRMGGSSPVAQLAQRVLQQKRIMPQPGQMPQADVTPASVPQNPQGFASGGSPMGVPMGMASPWWERSEAHSADSGFLHSNVPGRTDHIPANPAADSYVIPADVVSGLGEGNSLAGARALDLAFRTGPHGIPMPHGGGGRGIPHPPHIAMPEARGGKTGTVPVIVAGGEYIVPSHVVQMLGHGDHGKGHKVLDAFVKHVRAKTIKTMSKLPGPVKS